MPGLKISILQQPLVWMDGPANLRHFDRQLEGITGRDVIVLPEMFTTGFAMEAAQQSMPQQEVVAWMHAKAQQTNALIAGTLRCKPNAGRSTASCWSSRKGKCSFMINATCSAWQMNIITMKRVIHAWCSNGAAGVFCRWFATTCASRCGHATATITTWRCMSPTGLPALPALAVAAGRTRH